MKKIFLLFFLSLLTFSTLYSQSKKSELLNQRDQYFQHYRNFKDTLTVRTWLNMVELSKRLEAVVLIDNVLLDSLNIDKPKSKPADVDVDARVQEISSVKDQLITENARLNEEYSSVLKQKNNYIFILVVIAVILVLVSISWIRNLMRYKQIEKYSGKSNEKILNLKQMHKSEIDLLKNEIDKLKEDQLLMENTASQMKKSYEILKSEQPSNASTDGTTDEDGLDEVRREMEAIGDEVSSILEEKSKIEEDLKIANQELLKYQNANKTMENELVKNQDATKSIEDELEALLRKLKNE